MRNAGRRSFVRGHGGHRKSKQALLFASIGFISALASGGAFAQTAATSATTSTSTSAAATATSPAGTSIPSATQIVDASGAVWTISAGKVMRNGAAAGFSANVVQLYFDGSTVFQQNRAGGWWSWTGSTWADASNPATATTSATTTSTAGASTATAATSAAGTSVPSATQIVDASGAVWTISAGKVMRNGAPAAFSANVVKLYFNGSTVFQQNSAGGWWSWNGTDWAVTSNPTAASTTATTGSTTSTSTTASSGTTASTGTTASSGATSVPASLATSAAGTSVPSASLIVDSSLAVWTISAGKVMRNGAPAGFSANVVKLYFNGSTVFQQNSAGGWWSWNGSDWAVASNPTASTSTATGSTTGTTSSTGTTSTTSTTGSTSTGSAPVTLGAATTYEAEAMSLSGGYAVDGTLIKVATGSSGTATQVFGGASGTYNVQVFVSLESDGTPDLKLYRGSALLRDYTYPAGTDGQSASFTINNVSLVKGDVLRLVGTINAGALARVDKIVLTPVIVATNTPPSTANLTISASGTAIPPATQIVDASKAVWNISAGKVMRNGAAAGFSANVVGLYWNGSTVFQTNSAGGWWSWNGTTWVDAANPTLASTNPGSTGTSTGSTGSTGTSTGSGGSTTSAPPTATSSLPSGGARAVPTFESLGLYWTPPSSPGSAGCEIIYKKVGDTTWKKGLNMWYDSRNSECRGSIVMLTPNTQYEVQFAMPGKSPVAGLVAQTWSEQFPIAKTVFVQPGSSNLAITQGGSPSGYVLYTPAPGTSGVLDAGNGARNNITVTAPYVIVRGFTLKGAQADAIDLQDGSHDVVIEDNDISGWGRFNYTNSSGWQIGVDEDSGVKCRNVASMVRSVIQRNTIHDPRYGANSWSWGHPAGPQGTSYDTCGGNHVFRYNTIYSSDKQHYYNDGIGGGDNFTDAGFPREDSDIYGNKISQTWDDGIEAEGAGRNIRVWGNYIDNTATGVATTVVNSGPAYVFRNVYNRSRMMSERTPDADDRNLFAKSGDDGGFGGGRRYVFHNTLLQLQESGNQYPSGAGGGLAGPPVMSNTVSRNNIYHIWKSWWTAIGDNGGGNNDLDFDLYNGNDDVAGTEPHGIVGTPIYQAGNGTASMDGGMYQLAPNSRGFDQGQVIPNFNDGFTGSAPDIGAHEAGTPAMKFGVGGGTKEY